MSMMKSGLCMAVLITACALYSVTRAANNGGQSNTIPQSKSARVPTTKPTPHPESLIVKTHERFVSFLADENFSSELLLQNKRLDTAVSAKPALVLNGREVALDPVLLPPHGEVTVDLNAALRSHGLQPTRGVVVIRYDFSTYGALSAVVSIADIKHDLYMNFSAQSAEEFWSGNTFDAVVWAPDEGTEGFVSIINTYSEAATVRATFTLNGETDGQRVLTIAPHQQNLLSLDSLLKRSTRAGQPGGVHLEFDGDPGQIVAEGVLFNKHTGFAKHIGFTDKALHFATSSTRTHFLLLGRQPVEDGFPATVFFGSLAAVRNIDSGPVQVTPTVKFLRSGSVQRITLDPINLAANESRLIDFAQEQRMGHLPSDFIQGSLELAPNTDHTAIVSELFNFDVKNHGYVVGPSFGAHPMRSTSSIWRTDGTFQTTVMIENTAKQDDQVTMTLFSDQGEYNKLIDVPSGGLVKINVKDLQQKGIPDSHGRHLLGTYGTLRLSGSHGARSALAFDKLIHSADDSEYVGLPSQPCDFVTDFSPFLEGSVNPFTPFIDEFWNDGTEDTLQWTPSSENSNLVVVDSQGLVEINHSPDGIAHSVGLDFFDVILDCTACSTRDQEETLFVTVPVAVPTYFFATGADPLLSANCTPFQQGAGFRVHYRVLDQLGNFLNVAGMTPLETVTINGGTQFVNKPFATPTNSNPDGTFDDFPLGSCFGPPIPAGNPCVTDQQTFKIVYTNGITYPISTVSTSRQCLKGISLGVANNPEGSESFSIGQVN